MFDWWAAIALGILLCPFPLPPWLEELFVLLGFELKEAFLATFFRPKEAFINASLGPKRRLQAKHCK